LPDCKVLKKTIHLVVDDSHFICEREIVRNIGWREIIPAHQDDPKPSVEMSIPEWKAEDALVCEDFSIRERKTRPPSRFSEVELMRAMSEILPFIEDEQVRASLKGSDGIGTESTRAYAIDALFKRGYLIKGNKSVFSTSLARALIHALPKEAVDVGMTALWERELSNIAKMPFQEAKQSADHFLLGVVEEIRQFARYAQQRKNIHVSSPEEILGLDHEDKYRCPSCDSVLKLRSGRFGHFWGCSAYPACQTTLQDRIDEQGEHHPIGLSSPVIPAISADTKYLCPKCGSHLKKRQGQHGSFWGCTSYPACTYTTRKPLPH